jgi:hypothetical protein
MPRFDLENYASVGERLAQFHLDYPDGRIITELIETHEEPKRTWVVKATIYLSSSDQVEALPKATGHAAEIEGSGGANNVAPLPNAETSAIGRALMVMNYSMNKDPRTLASREEMKKVDRATRDWISEVTESRSEVTELPSEVTPVGVINLNRTLNRNINDASRLDEEWWPSKESWETMQEHFPELDLKLLTHDFIDYWTSLPGTKAKKLDWDKTWRNWARRNTLT